jgi:transposase-like protein
MILSRQEKEKLVLDLYNQGKNTREIAQEARMSFSAIGAILKKAEEEKGAQGAQGEQEQKLSLASQAYKLFSERKKTLAQVAIALNLREPEVTKFYMEYCKLTQLDSLCHIYDKIKDDIYPFVNLYILSKVARMDTQQVVRLLTIANNYLPSVEQRYEKLKREEASLKAGNQNSAMILEELSNQISDLRNTSDSCRLSCEQEKRQMAELHQNKIKLEALVNDFQNKNEEYLKIKKTVRDEMLGGLSNVKMFLRSALLSITESMRNNPERYRSIFYNMSSMIDYSSSGGQDYTAYTYEQQQQQSLSPDCNTETNAAIIIDEAEKLFDKLIKDGINKVITDYPFRKSPLPSSLPLLPQSDEQQSHAFQRPPFPKSILETALGKEVCDCCFPESITTTLSQFNE